MLFFMAFFQQHFFSVSFFHKVQIFRMYNSWLSHLQPSQIYHGPPILFPGSDALVPNLCHFMTMDLKGLFEMLKAWNVV